MSRSLASFFLVVSTIAVVTIAMHAGAFTAISCWSITLARGRSRCRAALQAAATTLSRGCGRRFRRPALRMRVHGQPNEAWTLNDGKLARMRVAHGGGGRRLPSGGCGAALDEVAQDRMQRAGVRLEEHQQGPLVGRHPAVARRKLRQDLRTLQEASGSSAADAVGSSRRSPAARTSARPSSSRRRCRATTSSSTRRAWRR